MALLPQIDIEFGDGSYVFALLLPQLIELEDKCGYTDTAGNRHRKGVIAIYSDIIAGLGVVEGQIVAIPYEGRASAYECREIIRLGLIGGGKGLADGASVAVDPPLALKLCQNYVDTAPLVKRWTLAAAILRAAVEGFEPPKKDEPAKAPAGGTARKTRSKRARSSSTAA